MKLEDDVNNKKSNQAKVLKCFILLSSSFILQTYQMADQKQDKETESKSVDLITEQLDKFATTADVVRYLYYEKRHLHPIQISKLRLNLIQNSDIHYRSIYITLRTTSERDLFIFKIHNDSSLKLNIKIHGQNSIETLRRSVFILSLGSPLRAIGNHQHSALRTLPMHEQSVVSRWTGLAVINMDKPKHIEIDIPIEPYHQCTANEICNLHTMEYPSVITIQIHRENVRTIEPTKNDEVRGYHINLHSMPHTLRFKTLLQSDDIVNPNPMHHSHCRYPKGFCPDSSCHHSHLPWLEDIPCGNSDTEWTVPFISKYVPAAMRCDGINELSVAYDVVDVLQFCSVLRMEFIAKVS